MYDTIIELGIIFLLIYTPLAFGGVSQGSLALMELVTGSLMLVWLIKLISQRYRVSHKRVDQQGTYHLPRGTDHTEHQGDRGIKKTAGRSEKPSRSFHAKSGGTSG